MRHRSRPEAVQEGAEAYRAPGGVAEETDPMQGYAHEMRLLNREILHKAHKGVGVGGLRCTVGSGLGAVQGEQKAHEAQEMRSMNTEILHKAHKGVGVGGSR